MKKLLVLSIVILIVTSGCAMMGKKTSQTLVGTWRGEMPNGGEIIMVYNEDMTMEGSIKGQMEFDFKAKYSVDYNADPITLDQFDFDNEYMSEIRFLSIIRFIDSNTIQVCGNPDSEGSRPTNFDYNMIEMTRE